MEVAQSVAHATAGGAESSRRSISSCLSFLSTDTFTDNSSEPDERTPLLISVIPSTQSSHPNPNATQTVPLITKECLNWRIIGLFLMFITGLTMATYLLWRETSSFPNAGYKLNLIQHDIWSNVRLEGQPLLQRENVVNVFITHTASVECFEYCADLLHSLQGHHHGELPFNFLVAGDCETYEARGWQYVSNFGKLPQANSLVLAFVGDFSTKKPSNCQLLMAQGLLWESVKRLKVQARYKLYALRNVTRSQRDASALQHQVMRWPLYAGEREVT